MVSLFLPYSTFQSHLVLLPSDVLLALLLVGDLSQLCIFYHNCKGWSKHSSWPCWIPLVAWAGRDTSGELNHLWILSCCHMDYISFGSFWLVFWHRADMLWWVFRFLLDVVSNGLFLSLPYMDDGSWNWGTVWWRWAYDRQMTWILALSKLLIHWGMVIYYFILSP